MYNNTSKTVGTYSLQEKVTQLPYLSILIYILIDKMQFKQKVFLLIICTIFTIKYT